jgi:hypothetical protein
VDDLREKKKIRELSGIFFQLLVSLTPELQACNSVSQTDRQTRRKKESYEKLSALGACLPVFIAGK